MTLLFVAIFLAVLVNVALLCVAARAADRRGTRGPTERVWPRSADLDSPPPAVLVIAAELAAEGREADLVRQLLTGAVDPATYQREMSELAHAYGQATETP